MIKVTFLGTADLIPSASRSHTAILLTYNGENILVDCGEGTQRQFRKARLNPCKITKILITHWHGDHILGIPGLLQTLAMSGYNKKLAIYGPKGTNHFMKEMFKTFVFTGKINFEVKEVSGKFFDNPDFYIEARTMKHGIPCNSYCFVKKGRVRIDKEKLARSGLPHGPLLQRLKNRKDVVYKGKKYKAKNLTFRDSDKKICFVLDTAVNKNIVPFVKDSDLLISESSFETKLKERARERHHMSASDAAKIAKKAQVKKLVLTHVSARYDKNPKKILNEAKKIFKNSVLVKDLDMLGV